MTGTAYDASSCGLCPRECHADRLNGKPGFCGCSNDLYVARAALHMWEEPCISGNAGSGTVFFTGCSLRCVFCQNGRIAGGEAGKKISVERLAEIFLEQQERGANNINLVTPTHYVPQIVSALKRAKAQGMRLPVVYNTGGYEKVSALRMLEGLVDVYLPDMKYMKGELGARYSNAPDYPERAKAALAEMYRQVGTPVFMPERAYSKEKEETMAGKTKTEERAEIMQRGMIVRHLVMPGGVKDSKAVIRYLYETYGDNIYMSIMSQYTPMPDFLPGGRLAGQFPELGRKLTAKEYDEVVDYAIELGVENAFIQEGDVAKESFIPDFNYEGV